MALYYSNGILNNLHYSKTFSKMPSPYVKFDENHDRDVAVLVLLTVLQL